MKFRVRAGFVIAVRRSRPEGVCYLQVFLASCEVALMFLPGFFHWDLLLRAQIPDPPEKVLSEVQRHPSAIQFPPVYLLCLAPLQICCSGILFPLACLSYRALL
jgi:hypothetical protein